VRAIDLREVLHRTVAEGYGDLVTRRTGAAVRGGIELVIAGAGEAPMVIDFSAVRLLDISCADEIIAKLVLQHGVRRFIMRGLSPSQRESLEPVLEHHGLGVVVEEPTGRLELLGTVGDTTRAALAELRAHVLGGGGPQPLPA
jgi:anti-anti-sigma regulatory factor